MFARTSLLSLLCIVTSVAVAQIPQKDLQLWLRADKGVQTTRNRVVVWQDQSPSRNDAFTATDTLPAYLQHEANGNPVIRFNGRNTGMKTKPFLTFPNKRGTIIVVARVNDTSSTSGDGYGTFASTYFDKGITWQMGANPSVLFFYDGVGGSGFPYATISPKDWLLLTLVRDDNTVFNFYRIDKWRTSFETKDVQPDTNSLKIGYNGGLEVFNGDIAEVIVYGRNLSAEELAPIHKYLQHKYNIYWPKPPFYESWWFYSMEAMAGLLLIIFVTKYIAQRNLKKRLQELERQSAIDKERLRISREMHDDIGAGLTRITLMSELAKQSSSNTKQLTEIAEASRQLVSSMSEIIWSLNPEHRSLGQLLAYLREQLNKLLEPSGIEYTLNFPEETANYQLNNEQKRNILLVTKEVVHNAVKHSCAKVIGISVWIEEEHLNVTIKDDGKGFNPQQQSGGNGLSNLKHRFEQLQADYQLNTEPGRGVITFFRIPLKSHL